LESLSYNNTIYVSFCIRRNRRRSGRRNRREEELEKVSEEETKEGLEEESEEVSCSNSSVLL
jgi:hypothetical protein